MASPCFTWSTWWTIWRWAITHVIRGEDHLSNTAKHIALFRAFGVEPPQYAHIPLILNADGTKMSKRDQGASLTTYMEEGYVPGRVVNYLCLLGWSPKDNREKLPLAEVVERSTCRRFSGTTPGST